MKGYTKVYWSTQFLLKSPPEARSEYEILVKNNRDRHIMQMDYLSDIDVSQSLGVEGHLNWNKFAYLVN